MALSAIQEFYPAVLFVAPLFELHLNRFGRFGFKRGVVT